MLQSVRGGLWHGIRARAATGPTWYIPRPMVSSVSPRQLIEAAIEARSRAYSPYSSFAVGAAVATEDGTLFTGCNVENRTFGLTVCAERTATLTAVAAGHRRITAVAVVADADPPAAPCGPCREVLHEFGTPDLVVFTVNVAGAAEEHRLAELLPHPFEFEPPAR